MIIYTYIESEEIYENDYPVHYRAYLVISKLPFDCTNENIDAIHFQYDLNETYT